MKDRDGNEFVWVPREAVRKMLDAAHFGPNCAEDELSAKDEQFWLEVWGAMIAAAPQFVAGDVTKEMCWNVFEDCDGCEKNMAETARHWLDRWRKELGPALGLVTREEMARSVEIRDTEIARLETDLELARIEVARLRDALDQSALEYADLAVSAKSLEEHLHALVEVSEDSTIARARAVMNGDDIGEDEDAARAGNGGVV